MTIASARKSEPQHSAAVAATAHSSFEWLRSHHIESLNLCVEHYRHCKTGALHYHLASDNPENVFLVGLRTVPTDSRGVAHILEHTVLCGSEKYPVRDPFFMMIRRSLNTFMNAMTSSDWTAYPFASKNRKDFENLLSIYLDAVFFSRLHELDFAQEGHRLEFTEMDNSDSELMFKGVVYNEMKGAMSAPAARLWQTMSSYMFPTTTYHHNSGGEPDHIPDLSYAQLKHFYQTHYHPSNAVFMTFGDIPAAEHQQRFEELALSRFDALDVDVAIGDEKRYLAPLKVKHYYPLDEEDAAEQTHHVVGWLLGHSTDLASLFEAQLLAAVLLDHSASPLLHVLETTPLGKSPSPLCGLEDGNREMSFMCGLEGCAESSTDEIETLILDSLREIAAKGVDQEQVEAALHQLELGQREISGDGHPYGLQLIMSGLSTVIHGGDPIEVLDVDPVLARLREAIIDRNFIPDLIHRLLLDNPHRVTLTLAPDVAMSQRQLNAEMHCLRAIKAGLEDADKLAIISRSQALAARQNSVDDDSILPKVGLEDVPPDVEHVDVSAQHEIPATGATGAQAVSFYSRGTNGLVYQQVITELPQLDDDLLSLLPLYTACLTELGVGQRSYGEVQAWQSAISGGLSCNATIRSNSDDVQQNKAILSLSGKALAANSDALGALIHDSFHQVRFDETQRIRELMEQIAARQQHSITSRGHMHAVNAACAGMSPAAALSHRFGGLAGIRAMKAMQREMGEPQTLQRVIDGFQQIHQAILAAPRQFLLIAEEDGFEALRECWQHSETGAESFQPLSLAARRERVREIWTTSTQVNFCAMAMPTVGSSHPDHAALCVLSSFMRNTFLHRTIREQGGAYGAGADQDANAAAFRFFSYRDPRLAETLQDFDRAVDWVLESDHPWQQIEEAILGVISSMDRSSSPAGAARQSFYNAIFGRGVEHRRDFRRRVLAVDLSQLQTVAARYLKNADASIAILGSSADSVPSTLGLKVEKL